MRIAFINPGALPDGRYPEAEDCCFGSGPAVLPFILLAAASEAQLYGHEVAFFDLAFCERDDILEFEPECIVYPLSYNHHTYVSMYMYNAFKDVHHVALAIPSGYYKVFRQKYPHISTVVEYNYESAFNHEFPFVRRGLKDLRDVCSVDYSLVTDYYWGGYQVLVYQITRGCPYRCRFCVWGGATTVPTKYSIRDADTCASDIKAMYSTAQENGWDGGVYLISAQLSSSRGWCSKFADRMEDSGILYHSNINLREIDKEIVQDLQRSGMKSASCGLEATGDRMLSRINKPFDLDTAIRGMKVAQECDLRLRSHIRYGCGESKEDVLDAIEGIRKIESSGVKLTADLANFYHLRGTRLFDECDYDLRRVEKYNFEHLVMENPPNEWMRYIHELDRLGFMSRFGINK